MAGFFLPVIQPWRLGWRRWLRLWVLHGRGWPLRNPGNKKPAQGGRRGDAWI